MPEHARQELLVLKRKDKHDVQVLEEVHELGHYPRRFLQAGTDKEKREDSLAQRITKCWSELDAPTQEELANLQKDFKDKRAEAVLEEVHELGHYPRRFLQAGTDKEKREDSLAQRITKWWSELDAPTQAELANLQKDFKDKRVEARVADMLDRLRAFGKWPQEHDYSQASDPDIIAEAQLAHDLRKCCSSGILNNAAVAEIDELHWIWLREREAEAMERNAAAQDRRRDAAKARTTRLRTLLKNLRSSKSRCDCNDFAHWYGLWRCNPELAIRLRLAGHHFEHCRLARSAVQPLHAMARVLYSLNGLMWGSCL
jgi:hypothetical protein